MDKKNLISCAKCHGWFTRDEMKEQEFKYMIPKIQKVCPYCGSTSYTAIKDETFFDIYDRKTFINKYYTY